MIVRVTRWLPLIRRRKLIQFLTRQGDQLEDLGRIEGAFTVRQLAANLMYGESLTVVLDNEEKR
jgi:hypothetical protein